MRLALFLALIVLGFGCHSSRQPQQIQRVEADTVRKYYQNGQLHSERITRQGSQWYREYHFPNGEIKVIATLTDSFRNQYRQEYDKSGGLRHEWKSGKDGTVGWKYEGEQVVEEYHFTDSSRHRVHWYLNGRKKEEYSEEGVSFSLYKWHENGVLAYTLLRDGFETWCYQDIRVRCLCGRIEVEWQNGAYRSADGSIPNPDFKSIEVHYFASGITSKSISKDYRQTHIREWESTGALRYDSVITAEQKPVNFGDLFASPRGLPNEGYPLLDSPNPLRDTTVYRMELIYAGDSIALLSVMVTDYDSLAQPGYHGVDLSLQKVRNKQEYGIPDLPFARDYDFYIHGAELLIGVSKKRPRKVIGHTLKPSWFEFPANRVFPVTERKTR